MSTALTEAEIIATLYDIKDPDLNASIVEMGLIYGADIIEDGSVVIRMTLTSPGCPYAEVLLGSVMHKLIAHPDIPDAKIELIWDPPWTPDRMSPNLRYELDMGLF
jgi:metal-sulfur cluster biosynthetic enzyme